MKWFLIIATLALIAPTAAFAKGPTAAAITGPGIDTITITITGDAENGIVSTFSQIVEGAGFFPAVFRPVPDPMLRSQPKVELGSRYQIVWTVPTPNGTNRLLQDVYPYATPYAVTYMRRGQAIYDMTTNGGWYTQTADLKQALVSVGLPAKPPTSSRLSAAALGGIGFGGALVLALSVLLAVRVHRRHAA